LKDLRAKAKIAPVSAAIAFSEMLYPEAPKPSQRDQQGALTFQ
jgi:hypothetical protein